MTTHAQNDKRAIVIGAGIAGLVTARVLSDHARQVTILERDILAEEPISRRGVPQGRHGHALLLVGQRLLDGWFPGLTEELIEKGAMPIDAMDIVFHQSAGHRVRADLGFIAVSMSRPLLENTLRRRLLEQCPNVTIVDRVKVNRPLVEDGLVVGVRIDGADPRADLVVDCSGRKTRSFDHLAQAGYPLPNITAIRIDVASGTRVVRRRAEGLTQATTHLMRTSQRRHVERLDRTPPGFLVLGDAICSFNSICGQDTSSAALQARALGVAIERHGLTSPTLARAFYKRAARIVDVPWRIAAGADFADPRTTGPKPARTDLVNTYLDMVFGASQTSLPVARQLTRVQNLLARPESLLTPNMIVRVLLASRRSPATLRNTTGRPTSIGPATTEPISHARHAVTVPTHLVSR